MLDISMQEYRDHDALSNHELQIFKNNPSSFIWNRTAPQDPAKATTAEIGTALHCMLLEHEKFDDLVIVSDIKGRTTQGFQKLQIENLDKIVLTEIEAEHIRFMALSAKCDPMFNDILNQQGYCEQSIFVDSDYGKLKIRPDKITSNQVNVCLYDVKTTANIEDWRSDKPWINPLFKFGYGFTAAYYMFVASIHFKCEVDEYTFLVVQTSASLGRYPVTVFKITKEELIAIGFWDDMLMTLEDYKLCAANNYWLTYESFPNFSNFLSDEVEIAFNE